MSKGFAKRESWSSLLAFVWAGTGAAVGLGNVWKFPYMAGSSGGSAFVILYIGFLAIVAIPVMISEITLGKIGQRNPIDTFDSLAKIHHKTRAWRFTGHLGAFTLFLIFCFYSVVAGWSLQYLRFSISGKLTNISPNDVQNIWQQFISNPTEMVLASVLFVFFTMGIVLFGVKKGVEKSCSIMMPGLFLILLALVIYAASQFGLRESLHFLFDFDLSKVSPRTIVASLGHAFFTLAIGACAMMVYGSYLSKEISVIKSVMIIAILDLTVALLSGLAIFPLIFHHGLSPSQGPGLMFISLPMVFSTLPYGNLVGALFFILLFFAALSSSLSFAEPLVNFLMERAAMKRQKAVIAITILTLIGATICALSFNLWQQARLFGKIGIFDAVADLSTNILLPIGGILIAIFAGLVVKEKDFNTTPRTKIWFHLWRFLSLYVAPFAIGLVLINSLL